VTAEIIAIGSELLTPFRQDTNSLFLTEKLNSLGIEVAFKTVVGDNHGNLVNVARIALERADIVIFMGGLGPTEDDLTRESVAEAVRLPLRRDPDIVAALYARFAQRRMKMPENNAKQGDVIAGAIALDNKTAPRPGSGWRAILARRKKSSSCCPDRRTNCGPCSSSIAWSGCARDWAIRGHTLPRAF
jgi:nicotinamide-nucleotide amidase